MSPKEIAARALGIRPSDLTAVEPIKHGLTNESWLVRAKHDAVVVRVSSQHWASLQIDRGAESIVLDVAAAAGIGAPILACDVERGLLVTRYLGPTCNPADLATPQYIDRLGRVFKHLHGLPLPRHVREVHLPTVIAGYLETLQTLGSHSPQTDRDVTARGLALASEIADSSVPRLCHNDVHHLNVIEGDPLRLVDWEYAGIGEPFFDLASVCVYHDYSMDDRERLLRAYLDTPSRASADRLAKCCWLFEYVRDLWTEVRGAIRE
jgi:thiamine kinase